MRYARRRRAAKLLIKASRAAVAPGSGTAVSAPPALAPVGIFGCVCAKAMFESMMKWSADADGIAELFDPL